MTASQIAQIVAAVGVALALIALVAVVVLAGRLRRLQHLQRVILGSAGERDLLQHVASLDERVVHLRTAVEDLGLISRDHESRIDACTSRVGVVRFDAYDDLGGRQSTAIALMDAKEDGVVVTTVISRDFARMYVKLLRDGRPDIPLAPEEIEAVDQARARAPFTVKPRMDEAKRAEEDGVAPEEEAADELEIVRELERQNRRRERQGLPPLDELPPPPSTQGWQGLDIPAGPLAPEDPVEDATLDRPIDLDAGDEPPDGPTDGQAAAVRGERPEEGTADEPHRGDGAPAGSGPSDLWFDDEEAPDWPGRSSEEQRP